MPHNKTMQTMDFDRRLAAVMARDRHADGAFVYAVTSTRIFCRPSCASRRPHRDHIAFFPSSEKAQAAGYRACLRCRPDSARSQAAEVAQRICRYIDAQGDDPPGLADLSSRFGLSPHHLARTFKASVGMTPKAYADLRRVERLKEGLRNGASVTNALYSAGFGSSSRLYERGNALLGMTPADYRRKGLGTTIDFTIANTTLGKLLVAQTTRGICAVKLGDSPESLERELHREYDAATLRRDDAHLAGAVHAIVGSCRARHSNGWAGCRCAGKRLHAFGVEGARGDSLRADAHLRRDRGVHRKADCGACRCPRHARRTRSRSSSLAIASCLAQAASVDTAGAPNASAYCSNASEAPPTISRRPAPCERRSRTTFKVSHAQAQRFDLKLIVSVGGSGGKALERRERVRVERLA